jgi:hypothetical protein
MVINSTNINKTKQSPLILTELTKHNNKKDHDILWWKSRSWLEIGIEMWRDEPVNGDPNPCMFFLKIICCSIGFVTEQQDNKGWNLILQFNYVIFLFLSQTRYSISTGFSRDICI